jgi:transcriptional regulator NrdR family protein
LFTTYERPSLADNKTIQLPDGNTEPFNLGKLIISIAKAFTHLPKEASYSSLWLAQTVEDHLSSQHEAITTEDIAAVAHDTLRHFDELAAVQYAAQHQLISSTRRRGRPSWREREPRTPQSPSQ